MTSFVDIRFAVAVFVIPNLVTNLTQTIIYHRELNNRGFVNLMLVCWARCFCWKSDFVPASGGVLEMVLAGLVLFLCRVPAL